MTQRHQFQVDRAVLKSLIAAQSGTAEKSLLEAVMNSADSGSTRCEITLTSDGFTVVDDGKGFADRDEFHQFFGVFGFDHEGMQKTYGAFGLGRGQLMALAKTTWRSADFLACVDIEAMGYTYTCEDAPAAIRGLAITGTFYKPMDGVELYHACNELKRLCKYAHIEVLLNGERISTDPSTERWDHVDDVGYYRLRDARNLEIYSQGIAVEALSSHRYGIGGVVVTKPGQGLQMNMARNQLLPAKCPVWKQVEAVVKKAAKAAADVGAAKNIVTDATRAAHVAQLMSRPDKASDLLTGQFLTLSDGRHVTIASMAARPAWTVAPDRSVAAERLHQSGATCCLSQRTLDRFGVTTVGELVARLKAHFADDWRGSRALTAVEAVDKLEDCPGFENPDFELIPVKALTKRERQALSVARWFNDHLAGALDRTPRTLVPGRSKTAEAWTDGRTYIAIGAPQLRAAVADGLPGWHRLVLLLVHEYMHDQASSLGHVHDVEFYQAFHDALFARNIQRFAMWAFARHCRRSPDVTKVHLSQLASLCDVDTPVVDGSLEDVEQLDVAA